MDSTLLTAGATVVAAIITIGIKITPRYTKRKDRRERMDRYRIEYERWLHEVKSLRKRYREGERFDGSELKFPEAIDFENSGISIDRVKNGALILGSMIGPLDQRSTVQWVLDFTEYEDNSLKLLEGLTQGDLDVTKDSLLRFNECDFLSSDFWPRLYFEDEVKGFIVNPAGASDFSMKVEREIDTYVSRALSRYVAEKVDSGFLCKLETLIRYKLLLESRYIFSFFATDVVNWDPKRRTLVDKYFLAQDGLYGIFTEYVDSEYKKAVSRFLKKGKM